MHKASISIWNRSIGWKVISVLLILAIILLVLFYLDKLPKLGGSESQRGVERDVASDAETALINEANAKTHLSDVCFRTLPDKFRPSVTSPIRKGFIHVSMASYRDNECKETIRQLFDKAKWPDRITVGVVQQNKLPGEDCVDLCETCSYRKSRGQIRIMNLSHLEARGPCLARFHATKLWKDEEYYLQIDSHTQFSPNWDEDALRQIKDTKDPKAVLGGLPPGPDSLHMFRDNKKVLVLCRGNFGANNDSPTPILASATLKAPLGYQPIKTMTVAAGFMMMPYQAIIDVPYDPYLNFLFMGEEILYSARLWTSGYNMYTPRKQFLSHHYGRHEKPRFWGDLRDYSHCTKMANQRFFYMMGECNASDVPEDYRRDLDKFGMGKVRTIQDFKRKIKLNIKKKQYGSICRLSLLKSIYY